MIRIVLFAVAMAFATAVFVIVSAVAAPAHGIRDSHQVYRASVARGAGMSTLWSRAEFRRAVDAMSPVQLAASSYSGEVRQPAPGESVDPARLSSVALTPVTGDYFAVLGGPMALGRALTQDDERSGASPVVVLSHVYWTAKLAADPAILGRTIRIASGNGEFGATVVGVAAGGFAGVVGSGPPGVALPEANATLAGPLQRRAQIVCRQEPRVSGECFRSVPDRRSRWA